jgi:hypothetical protein
MQQGFHICLKPTFTDFIIPNDARHPFEHKKAGTNYLRNKVSVAVVLHHEEIRKKL